MERKKNILLAVTGMSPAVVTETIYALHQEGTTIDEIQIITTKKGKKQAWLTLGVSKNNQPTPLEKLQRDYQIPAIKFDESSIHVVPDAKGNLVEDARTKEDQVALADFITQKVRELTSDQNNTLFASLAGGRKTMTFFLGYAMSLFGRRQDSLSHVLVTPGYETLTEFYYPTPYVDTHTNRDGEKLDARDAQVELADIPFIRMREEMPTRLIDAKQPSTYSETVELMNLLEEEPKLTIHVDGKSSKVLLNGKELILTPVNKMFYCWLAVRAKYCVGGIPYATNVGALVNQDLQDEAQFFYQVFIDNDVKFERFGIDFIRDRKNQIAQELKKCLPVVLANQYKVTTTAKTDSFSLNGINLPPEQIEIVIEDPTLNGLHHSYSGIKQEFDWQEYVNSYAQLTRQCLFG
ncbi:CRISPR-associated ring nuclease Csm6 [Vibrio sp. WXL210]|uniref:CRISPR-associated ring nuclease Csm6 n=1 Tax=Vibrio sp. WXL210 TaxID=3450709 RepID=UPI003EC83B83